jgi:heat-inducible transcriptional repressor
VIDVCRNGKVFLNPRQQAILKAIVDDYVQTAEPVGSRVLSKRFNFGLSPATLRNEMADLEEGGLLRQPHTSAGRIPSDAGYRVFVDLLMDQDDCLSEEMRVHLERFTFAPSSLRDVLAQAAKLTAVLTRCTAIVRSPNLGISRIGYVQLLTVGDSEFMLIVHTQHGASLSQVVEWPGVVTPEELSLLTNFLNHHLCGRYLDQVTDQLLRHLIDEVASCESTIRGIWQQFQVLKHSEARVLVSSVSHLIEQPEFVEAQRIRSLLNLLEREATLAEVLMLMSQGALPRRSLGGSCSVTVAIGRENPLPELQDCSVISAPYYIGNQAVGEIGVIGPTRLGYWRAMLAVEAVADRLSRSLTRLFGQPSGTLIRRRPGF